MDVITRTSAIIARLAAGAALVVMAAEILPRLVDEGRMSPASAATVLDQVPRLREDIQRQIDAVAESLGALQDRVEVLGQFLLLHRDALAPTEVAELEQLLSTVRG
jgi:hypothetical protein